MSDCEMDGRSAAGTVHDRTPLRYESPEEERDDVSMANDAKEMRLEFPPPAEPGVFIDCVSGGMECAADAAGVFAGEARDSEGARSDRDDSRGTRVRTDDVFRGRDTDIEGHRTSEAEVGEGAITCDGVRFSDAEVGKGEYGSRYFSSTQSMADGGSSDGGSEEVMETKQEPGQTRVPSWCISSQARDWMDGFEVGDMVWGKVKSHPWWPGHIFNEAFASSSVRRAKREGHVLVAFFGDSSYGWFDLAELIPFDLHYAEKSRQTTSRNFTKAVEEAVDEASRRSALALSCRCRNPSNFRPTTVPGYFVVDVAGYEPGGVYSSKQIRKARDNFVTADVLSFVNQLALTPHFPEQGSIDWIKNMATLLALRKAMFEEFDVTYAEAFGVQPVLPSRAAQGTLDQPERVSSRAAPLSGPLVIAETLGERKATSKAVGRAKDTAAKKNKYLFKRREETTPSSLKSSPPRVAGNKQRPPLLSPSSTVGHAPATPTSAGQLSQRNARRFTQDEAPNVHYHLPHGHGDIIVAAAGGGYRAEVGNYVLQKRVPEKQQTNEESGKAPEFGALSPQSPDGAAEPTGRSRPPVQGVGTQKISQVSDVRMLNTESPAAEDLPVLDDEGSATVKLGSGDGNKNFHHEYKPAVDAKEAVGLKAPDLMFSDTAQVRLMLPQSATDRGKEAERIGFAGIVAYGASPPLDVVDTHQRRLHQKPVGDVVQKALKHPREDHRNEEPGVKTKRKKKDGAVGTSKDHPPLKQKNSESPGVSDDSLAVAEAERKVDGAPNSCTPPDSVAIQQLPKQDWASHDLDLPAVLGDLSALALDPFFGAERNAATVVRHVLLRFRSLVYEKALPFTPSADHDTSETHSGKLRAGRPLQEARKESAGIGGEGEAREQRESTKPPRSAPARPILKPNDLSKTGRKRLPSDRQEEKLAKRLKKLEKLKALTSAEKKAAIANKTPDLHPRGGEQKDAGATALAPVKTVKADSFKKQETPTPPKAAIPTYLVMKFPQRTTLPSISSLKARFARFGPLDLSGTRVFWRSYTCRVLFKHKTDAQAACSYAQSNDIFGQVKVNYFLRDREFESPVPDPSSDPIKRQAEDNPQFRTPGSGDLINEQRPTTGTKQQSQSSAQLKSILKKPSGDEAAPAGGGGGGGGGGVKETQRVKFLLGGDDGRGETGGSVAVLSPPGPLDLNRKGPKSVTFLPPLQPPLQIPPRSQDVYPLPPPPAPRVALPDVPDPRGGLLFGKALPPQARYGEMEVRERSGVDISHQMLSLLARCSDIVTNVKSTLGYVPYHPL